MKKRDCELMARIYFEMATECASAGEESPMAAYIFRRLAIKLFNLGEGYRRQAERMLADE